MAKKKESTNHKTTLTDKAYQTIKRGILQGQFEEGTFLSGPDVMKKYGIGRTPFREACNRLHHERILEVVPRRGYLIPEISFRAVRDLFEVRVILEGIIGELAAVRATETQIEELEFLAKRSWSSDSSNAHYEKMVKTNTDFHLCLARMTQNRELVRLAIGILERTERLSYMELRSARLQSKEIQMLHKPIVEAISKRDAIGAKQAIINDIRHGQIDIFGRDLMELDQQMWAAEPAGHGNPSD